MNFSFRNKNVCDFSNVCIVDSVYSLLIYLLLINEKECNKTFFFFITPIHLDVCKNFTNSKYIVWPKTKWKVFVYILYYKLIKKYKYPFLKKAIIYGLDNLQLSPVIVGNKNMRVIEDGLLNYIRKKHRSHKWIKSIISGPLMKGDPYGYSDLVDKIYLTGLAPIPKELSKKVEIVDINQKWLKMTDSYRKQIMSYFNLDENVLKEYQSVDSILFTQPLYEDGTIEETEKIEIYKEIIGNRKIAIKPHPKETTDYTRFFPNAIVLRSSIPIELFSLIGVRFKHAYTLFSTVALTFNYQLDVHFVGTRVHPKILKRFGDIVLENGVVKRLDSMSDAIIN